jgi:hypothetical protein
MRRPKRSNRRFVTLLIVVLLVVACADARPSVPSPSIGPTPPPAVATSPAEASPSVGQVLEIDALPPASLDPATQTAVCDKELYWLDEAAGEATITCVDGLVLGLRALKTIASAPIERLYFQRPPCKATPCTDDQLGTATVTGWTSTDAFSVALDSRRTWIDVPTPDAGAIWPAAGSSSAPAIERPVLKGAPAEVAGRTPYPYCGEADLGQPETVTGCFRDAVLSGRPAEFIDNLVATEGGEIIRLYRFDGRGALWIYQGSDEGWFRQPGSMTLGYTPGAFDFEPWSDDVRF